MSPGDVLGDRFELIGELGRGGMATVWLAQDRTRGERVALKVLHAHLADDPAARERLVRELRAASRIRHPNVLVANEIHELDGQMALTMPVHEGVTLAEAVATGGPMSGEALGRLARELSGALAEAHRQGVTHRDLTPNNVLIDERGSASLVDFGLSRLEGGATATATSVAGTWGYAAPEVFEGERADPRGDLYSLGAVLWFAATGQSPFHAESPGAILKRQLEGELEPLGQRRPDLSVATANTIDALLERDPEDRPDGAGAVRDALEAGRMLPAPLAAPERGPASAGQLPPGMYTVVIGPRQEDRKRRRRLRRGRGPIGAGEDAEPERALAAAAAREAGLAPPSELPPEMRRLEYKLVEGVGHDVAERLANTALVYGLVPRLVSDPHLLYSKTANGLFILGVILMSTAVAPVIGGLVIGPQLFGLAALWFALSLWMTAAGWNQQRLLTAFPRTPLLPGAPAAPEIPLLTDSAGPVARVLRRTEAQLDALDAALTSAAGESPEQAVGELSRTLTALRGRAAELATRAVALRAENERTLDASDAARRIQARLRRLETLGRGGQPADEAELDRLRSALEVHKEQLLARDRAESLETLVSARLLEIGAAADKAARSLRGDEDLLASARDLLGKLVQESEDARAAAAESDPSRAGAVSIRRETS